MKSRFAGIEGYLRRFERKPKKVVFALGDRISGGGREYKVVQLDSGASKFVKVGTILYGTDVENVVTDIAEHGRAAAIEGVAAGNASRRDFLWMAPEEVRGY